MKTIKVYNARDDIEAKMIESYLEQAGIRCYSVESGSGEYMMISQGFSVYGRDIMVNEEDEKAARDIIESVLESDDNSNDEGSDLSGFDSSYDVAYKKSKLFRRVFAIVALVIIGVVLVASLFV